jgi:hypothetical protein
LFIIGEFSAVLKGSIMAHEKGTAAGVEIMAHAFHHASLFSGNKGIVQQKENFRSKFSLALTKG